MSHSGSQHVLSFVPDALTASKVGVWRTDFGSDRTCGDATLAALFGVDPREAADGMPLGHYLRNVILEDRSTLAEKLEQVRTSGGLFVVEYRTRPASNEVRWILVRGRYERDPRTGAMIGRGIAIDITDSKRDGQIDDRAFFVEPDRDGPSLDHVASLALQVRNEVDQLGHGEASPLRRAADALLLTVGRAIAAHVEASPGSGRLN